MRVVGCTQPAAGCGRWGGVLFPIVLAGFLVTGTSGAQPAGFQATYSKGVKLENKGELVEALAAFESIPADKRDVNTRLHIAGCKEKLKRFLAARDDYEALRTDPKSDPATVDTAAAALSDLVPRIPVVRLSVVGAGVEVRLDDKVVVAGDLLADPGPHRIVAARGPTLVFERKLDLAESSTTAVHVDAPPPTPAPAPMPAPPPVVAEAPPSRISGLPFYVGGGVALLAAGGAYLLSTSAARRVDERCKEQLAFDCDEEAAGAGTVRTWQTVSAVSAGLGVVAIGVGLAIDLSRPSTKQAASVRVQVSGTGFQLVGRF